MKKMEKTLVPASRTGRRFFSGMAFLLLALCSTTFTARAQGGSFASRLGYSAALMAEGFGEDHSFATLDLRIKYAVSPSFSVFVPIDVTELLYNKSTTKNFDFAAKSGVGVRAGHEFASGDELALSLAGLSTIGKAESNYWQVRLMGEWVMPSSLGWRTFVGIGVEYLAPYKGSSHFGGFYPVVSVGLSL